MKRTIAVLLFIVCFAACDRAPKDARQVYMLNHSSQRIIFLTSSDFPDTVGFQFNGCRINDIASIVKPGAEKVYTYWGYWESLLERIPSGTMMFFVYNADTAQKYYSLYGFDGCDSLRNRPGLI